MKKAHCTPRQRGFTLLELLIAVAIVGILGAIAYPSYVNQVARGYRTEAKVALNQLALWMERNRANNPTGDYTAPPASLGLTTIKDSGGTVIYDLYVKIGATGNGYYAWARQRNAQAKRDTCFLTIDHLGRKGIYTTISSGTDITADYGLAAAPCWDK